MSTFTKKAILQTFTDMLRTTPFDKITVSALTKQCGISHNTFYYHFQDIYDLLDTWLEEKFRSFDFEGDVDNWGEKAAAFLCQCQENKRLIYHIFDSISRDRLEHFVFNITDDYFTQYVHCKAAGKNLTEWQEKSISEFLRYAFIGFFLRFLWSNMDIDVDRSIHALEYFANDLVSHAIERASDYRPEDE